jgi:Uma2 family endonuclease
MTVMRSESLYKIEEPDIIGIVTEDDTPVDNMFSEKQRRLLTESLNSSWNPGRNFIAASDVGIFYAVSEPPIVPDMFLSLDVRLPEDLWKKKNRSYFLWEYGKPPELVVEIVSNTDGGENSRKIQKYAQIGVWYYVIFDPQRYIQNDVLRIYECFAGQFIPKIDRILQRIGLGLMLWDGEFEGKYDPHRL